MRLLEKHCPLSSFEHNTNGKACSIFEGNELQTSATGKQESRVQQHDDLPLDEFSCFNSNISAKAPKAAYPQFVPSQSYCQKKQVVSFIWAVCRSIVPPDLLGSSVNWRILTRNISRFVHLRRFEKFSLKQCMHKLKTSMFLLLSNKHSSCYSTDHVLKYPKVPSEDIGSTITDTVKHKVIEKWIFWLFSCVVLPLVQANFYVTESEHGKQEVFYYRKSVWEKVTCEAVMCFRDRNYRPLNDASVRNIVTKRPFGFSRVRLLPKENGVRALANLKASSRMPVKRCSLKVHSHGRLRKVSLDPKHVDYDYFKSVNVVLRDLHAVLKGLQMIKPEKLGSSVFDYNDIYRKICSFLSLLRNGSTIVPSVFIVVADVSKAFDSVDQDKLLSVMEDVIQNDEYRIEKSHQVVCAKKSLWVRQNVILRDQSTSVGSNKFTSFASNHSLHSVLVNQAWSRNIRKEWLFFILNEHVKNNLLQLDKKYYLQNVGIPQGSVLSSLLCSFYYGHLETNALFPFLQKSPVSVTEDLLERHSDSDSSAAVKSSETEVILSSPKYMLCRLIDDFLFVSTSKRQAATFFSRLRRGFGAYNCYMNEEKFGLNFDTDHICGLSSNKVHKGEDGIPFVQWSGLFINCCTLEIQADYTRYLNTHLRSTLTVCWQGKPGRHLKAKLCDYLRPKCYPIFYDSNINSAAVVRLNIYQAFLLCAMKFHCYVCELSEFCSLGTKSYMDSIERSLRYMYRLMKRRMHSVDIGSSSHPVFQVERGEVKWLGLMAYIRVLRRKQTRHRELLSLLRSNLKKHEQANYVSPTLKYAVDDSHSSVMWKIKY